MTEILEALMMMTVLCLLLGAGALLVDLYRDWRRHRRLLPDDDDPRLRNIRGVAEWRAKRRRIGRWVA